MKHEIFARFYFWRRKMGQIYAMNSILDQDNDDYRSVKAAPINQIGGGYICLT